MNKYILIGIPDCGKSTLGRLAAETLQMPFFDTDLLAVEKLNLEHPTDMFRSFFNRRFLIEQHNVMTELAELKGPAIIATGAETALTPGCAELMKKMGTVIHIQRKPEILLDEYRSSGKRGIIMRHTTMGKEESIKDIDMHEEAIKLYAEESAQYEKLADLTLENNGSQDEGLEKLIMLIKGVNLQ